LPRLKTSARLGPHDAAAILVEVGRLRNRGDTASSLSMRTPRFAPPLLVQPPFVWTPTSVPRPAYQIPEPELPHRVSMSL
jgi:hypothetical protein